MVHGPPIENDGLFGWKHAVNKGCGFLLLCFDGSLNNFLITLFGFEGGECPSDWVFGNNEIEFLGLNSHLHNLLGWLVIYAFFLLAEGYIGIVLASGRVNPRVGGPSPVGFGLWEHRQFPILFWEYFHFVSFVSIVVLPVSFEELRRESFELVLCSLSLELMIFAEDLELVCIVPDELVPLVVLFLSLYDAIALEE